MKCQSLFSEFSGTKKITCIKKIVSAEIFIQTAKC